MDRLVGLMFIVAVVNLKGGCGKTTLSTQLAGRFAAQGHRTLLGDLDRQQSAIRWVERRPATLPLIESVELDVDAMVLPFGEGRMVIDVPAGMKRKALEVVVRAADALVVPVLPSVFDEQSTERFLRVLGELKPVRKGRRPVAIVANRVRSRSPAARALDTFLAGLEHPAVARISDSQHYASGASTGITLFDMRPGSVRAAVAEWTPLLEFLDKCAAEQGETAESAAG